MTLQTINLGQNPNDGTGDPVRTAFGKTNANIDELSTRTTAAQAAADAAQATGSAAVPLAQKGAADGVAPLGSDSKIPAAYLPSYVDDVLEFSGLAAFPAVGEPGKIYVAQDDNRIYRWSGAVYVELSPYPHDTDVVPEGAAHLYFTQPRVITALTENAESARAALGVYSEGQTIPIFPAASIPTANVGSDIEVTGVGLMTWNATTARYEILAREHGQCQFLYVSPTECRLFPCNGNGLVINGRQYRVPAAGVAITNAAMTASTSYLIFAKDNGSGGIALEAGRVADGITHARHTDGVEIKSGDPTRTLVGRLIPNTVGQFEWTNQARLIASWFNRRKVVGYTSISNGVSNASAQQISNTIGMVLWSDSITDTQVTGSGYLTGAPATVTVGAQLDAGGWNVGYPVNYTAPGNSYWGCLTFAGVVTGPTEGYHSIAIFAAVDKGTALLNLSIFCSAQI